MLWDFPWETVAEDVDEKDDDDVQEEETVVEIPGRGNKLIGNGGLSEARAEVVETCPEGDADEFSELWGWGRIWEILVLVWHCNGFESLLAGGMLSSCLSLRQGFGVSSLNSFISIPVSWTTTIKWNWNWNYFSTENRGYFSPLGDSGMWGLFGLDFYENRRHSTRPQRKAWSTQKLGCYTTISWMIRSLYVEF